MLPNSTTFRTTFYIVNLESFFFLTFLLPRSAVRNKRRAMTHLSFHIFLSSEIFKV